MEEVKTENLSLGEAIEAMEKNPRVKVARKGWNGKGMYLFLKPARVVVGGDPSIAGNAYEGDISGCIINEIAEENGGEILMLPTVCMYTHDSTGRKAILIGWLASQSDMLIHDFYIVNPEEL